MYLGKLNLRCKDSLEGIFRFWQYQRYNRFSLRTGKGIDQAMKCDRHSEDCCKEARFQVDIYEVKRVEKGAVCKYERKRNLGKLFLCENHAALFNLDKVNYEVTELKIEVAESSLIKRST